MIAGLGFSFPLLLLGLLVLPILWWLLRAVPPAPLKERFPGITLLLGLKDEDSQSDTSPWWLLLLRLLAVAAAIVGFAGPILNPDPEATADGPVLIVMDASWASASDWQDRLDRARVIMSDAGRQGRAVALVRLTDLPPDAQPQFQTANRWLSRLDNLEPAPYVPDFAAAREWVAGQDLDETHTYWFSDGLDHADRDGLLMALDDAGDVTVFEGLRTISALSPPRFEDGEIVVPIHRTQEGEVENLTVQAYGLDPAGIERELARETLDQEVNGTVAEIRFDLPAELRNRISRFEISGARHAGAVVLSDDSLQRREIGLISGASAREGQALLAPLHYLRQALAPNADLLEVPLTDLLLANPDVLIFADIARLSPEENAATVEWVEQGGLLVRFAGPRLAGSDLARETEDPLMPVRLREGGRTVGGTMSWGEPKALRPFTEDSPFYGLDIPGDVLVESQVLAQPDPSLPERTIAALADGTPLVTRVRLEQGQVVLFHVTANAEWSSLPISGLFVQMLERLAVSTRQAAPDAEDLEGFTWVPEIVLNGFGERLDGTALAGVSGTELGRDPLSAQLLPGLYSGADRQVARNVLGAEETLAAATWPIGTNIQGLRVAEPTNLAPYFLMIAFLLLLTDSIAVLWLSGRLSRIGKAAAVLAACLLVQPAEAQVSDDDLLALLATSEITLGYVQTGDPELDERSRSGLYGLGLSLAQRTSVEPAAPLGVDLESDELVFFPLIYWPITANQTAPSDAAYARLNAYLRGGGMLVLDTRDADIADFGATTPNLRRLRELAAPLDVPPLEPVPEDHVLTRSFYLLQIFPGRHAGRDVWVEAAPADAEQVEGMPFRNLNDGVTPIVIGGNDWAAAWATDEIGRPLYPVGRGYTGERQREIAIRFGVNLVVHVLSGNYKSDQVHVPALLERLGQ